MLKYSFGSGCCLTPAEALLVSITLCRYSFSTPTHMTKDSKKDVMLYKTVSLTPAEAALASVSLRRYSFSERSACTSRRSAAIVASWASTCITAPLHLLPSGFRFIPSSVNV